MKKLLLFALLIPLSTFTSFGQACTPDPLFTQPGVYPDSATNFDTAFVGTLYNQLITIVVPQDTQAFPPPIPPIPWDSTRLDSVTGLPTSMSYACWNNNGSGNSARCKWKGNTKGCSIITGTPTAGEVGTHLIKFYTSNFVGGQSAANPYAITYYKIVVMPASNGVSENPKIQIVMQNNPNPMVEKTEIQFTAEDNGVAQFKIYNIIGTVVQQNDIAVKKGINKIELDSKDFDSGIYFYSVSHGNNAFTRKMIVKK